MPFRKAISEPDNPYHLDTFYNKKRNFPNAEEREYDDIEPVTVLLTMADQTIKGALFIPIIFYTSPCGRFFVSLTTFRSVHSHSDFYNSPVSLRI